MREAEFRSWLATHRNLGERTIRSRISNCRTVERYEGDLDTQFEQDNLQELTRRLTYSNHDEVAKKPVLHRIPINGNIYNGTATLRSAVSLYKQFRESETDDTHVRPRAAHARHSPPASLQDTTTVIQDPPVMSPGTVLQNRYRIVRKLGEGGMGAVYEAVDQRLDCLVALKEATVAGDEARRAFHREASLLANLRHRALPNVMDHFSESIGQFLVMEFIPGEDLAGMLKKRQRFEVGEVLRWADVILGTLEYLHARNPPILHRDIKPANLKLTEDDELFLLDFGLAKGRLGQMQTMLTTRSVFGHTPVYSPLEQIIGTGTDERSDLYALGATLYHLLTGTTPIDAPTRYTAIEEGRNDPLPTAHSVNAEVTSALSGVIQRAMAVARRDRWSTAAEMRAALQSVRAPSNQVSPRNDSQVSLRKASSEEKQQRIIYLNNCQNRDHVKIYGPSAFYDLNTTGFQSTLALNLPRGQKCVVATTGNENQIVFSWFSFLREEVRRDDRGVPCRVFFGEFIKAEEYSKTEAALNPAYTAFFDINGNFKRHSVIEEGTALVVAHRARKTRTRSITTEEQFFAELQKKSPAEATVAKKILDWARLNFTEVNWRGSSFVPVLDYGGKRTHNPITVFGIGKFARVGIKFGRMKNRNGLSEGKRFELLRRLNNIPGVHLRQNDVDKYPNIPLSALTDDSALKQLLDAIEWTNDEVKAVTKVGIAN